MTEDEAKTKWCPFARVMIDSSSPMGGIALAGVNRPLSTDRRYKAASCLATGCMLWRKFQSSPGGYCGLGQKDGAP